MNTKLKSGIISLESFLVNIFQTHVAQRLGYCLMEKNVKGSV